MKQVFLNQAVDKAALQKLVFWFAHYQGINNTIQLLEALKNFGFQAATDSGVSICLHDLQISPEKKVLIKQTEAKNRDHDEFLYFGQTTELNIFLQKLDLWHTTSELLKNEAVFYFRQTNVSNPVFLMVFSGARGNISQVRQLVGIRGLMANSQGDQVETPIKSNFREGLNVTEYLISCYGSRKGLMDTALGTASAGYLTRRLVDVAHTVSVLTFDCLTQKGISVNALKTSSGKVLKNTSQRLMGRVLLHDVYNNNQLLIAKKGIIISSQLGKSFQKLNLQKIKIRSPLSCSYSLGTKICQLCYGTAQAKIVELFETVGIIAAQSIGEPGTQLTLRTFHTGGVFSGNITKQFYATVIGTLNYSKQSVRKLILPYTYGKIGYLTTKKKSITISHSENKTRKTKFIVPKSTLILIPTKTVVWKKQVIGQIITLTAGQTLTKISKTTYTVLKQSSQIIFLNQIKSHLPLNQLWLRYGQIILTSKNENPSWGFYKLSDQYFFPNIAKKTLSLTKLETSIFSNFTFNYGLSHLSQLLKFYLQLNLIISNNQTGFNFIKHLYTNITLPKYFSRSFSFNKNSYLQNVTQKKVKWYYYIPHNIFFDIYKKNSVLIKDGIQFLTKIQLNLAFYQNNTAGCLIWFVLNSNRILNSKFCRKIQAVKLLKKVEFYPFTQYVPNVLIATPVYKINLFSKMVFPNSYVLISRNNYFFTKKDQLTIETSFPYTSELKQITQKKIGLNLGQKCFFPFQLNKHLLVKTYDILFTGKPFFKLNYNTSKTNDITQGLPKIEELLEVRQKKNTKLIANNPTYHLNKKFIAFFKKFTFLKAIEISILETQLLMVDTIQQIYQSQGVTIEDKHLEIIIKQLTSKVKINDVTNKPSLEKYAILHGYLKSEFVDLSELQIKNQYLKFLKKPLIFYNPKVLGLTSIGLNLSGIFSAASFQQTVMVLTQAALESQKEWFGGLKERVLIGKTMYGGTTTPVVTDFLSKLKAYQKANNNSINLTINNFLLKTTQLPNCLNQIYQLSKLKKNSLNSNNKLKRLFSTLYLLRNLEQIKLNYKNICQEILIYNTYNNKILQKQKITQLFKLTQFDYKLKAKHLLVLIKTRVLLKTLIGTESKKAKSNFKFDLLKQKSFFVTQHTQLLTCTAIEFQLMTQLIKLNLPKIQFQKKPLLYWSEQSNFLSSYYQSNLITKFSKKEFNSLTVKKNSLLKYYVYHYKFYLILVFKKFLKDETFYLESLLT